MQTFLPDPNFSVSLSILDNKRLNKQKVEAYQIYCCLKNLPTKKGTPYKGWKNHPATKMWKGYENALAYYYNLAIKECINRGFKNTMQPITVPDRNDIIFPEWLGSSKLHSSHRSRLLCKDFKYYSKFCWIEPPTLECYWPTK